MPESINAENQGRILEIEVLRKYPEGRPIDRGLKGDGVEGLHILGMRDL